MMIHHDCMMNGQNVPNSFHKLEQFSKQAIESDPQLTFVVEGIKRDLHSTLQEVGGCRRSLRTGAPTSRDISYLSRGTKKFFKSISLLVIRRLSTQTVSIPTLVVVVH